MGWSSWSTASQERWKSVATIFSLIAVPIILAIGGWMIQRQVSQEGVKQQYVQLALGILREPLAPENKEADKLRRWAVAIVDRNAPVKLTPEGRAALFAEGLQVDQADFSAYWGEGDVRVYGMLTTNCKEEYIVTGDKKRYDNCVERQHWLEAMRHRGEQKPATEQPKQ